MRAAHKPVRIVYDQQVFAWQRHGGISRYVVEVAARLARRSDVSVTVLAPLHVTSSLRLVPPGSLVGRAVPTLRGTGRLRVLAAAAMARRWLARRPADIVHETYYAARSVAPARTATIVTVHDMIHELFPEAFPAGDDTAQRKVAAIRRARRVICVSESTRRDLLRLVNVEPERVVVVHHGAPDGPLAADGPARDSPRARPPVDGPYLLYVGQRAGYKNFDGLLRALGSAPALARGLRLVAFGGGPLRDAERARARAVGLPATALQHVDGGDAVLAALYAHAAALVYPSLYEGFGLPPLEAMAYACPVVCSDTSSLPEVVGNAAELFDPRAPESIAAAINRVVGSPTRAAELRALGQTRRRQFSWDRCARSHHEVYRDAGASAGVRRGD